MHGRGLELGGPHPCSFALLHKWRASGDDAAQLCGLLECILCAGVWTPARVNQCYPEVSCACPLCGRAMADAYHLFWTCPKLDDLHLPEVDASSDLCYHADANVYQHPCLWLRGLLPADLLVPQFPPPPGKMFFPLFVRHLPPLGLVASISLMVLVVPTLVNLRCVVAALASLVLLAAVTPLLGVPLLHSLGLCRLSLALSSLQYWLWLLSLVRPLTLSL